MELDKLLRSVGKKTFIRNYELFKNVALSNAEVIDKLPQHFTLKARNSKTGHARKIFKDGLGRQALENIIASPKMDSEVTEEARKILANEID